MNPKTIHRTENNTALFPARTRRLLLTEDNNRPRKMLNDVVQEWSFTPSAAATLQQERHIVLVEEPFAMLVSDPAQLRTDSHCLTPAQEAMTSV